MEKKRGAERMFPKDAQGPKTKSFQDRKNSHYSWATVWFFEAFKILIITQATSRPIRALEKRLAAISEFADEPDSSGIKRTAQPPD